MNKLKAIDYLKKQLENENQLVKDNPEIKESSKDNIKALEEMIFELVQLQDNHNNSILLKDIDEKINTIKSRLTIFIIIVLSSYFGVIFGKIFLF